MFSVDQKRKIAAAVEKVLLDFHHPEMPIENPRFKLHVDGAESWSWADIEPNWIFDDAHRPGINPFNENCSWADSCQRELIMQEYDTTVGSSRGMTLKEICQKHPEQAAVAIERISKKISECVDLIGKEAIKEETEIQSGSPHRPRLVSKGRAEGLKKAIEIINQTLEPEIP